MFFKKRFFSKQEEQLIIAAIREAENQTSGEIRIHLSNKVKQSVLEDAAYYFTKLNMHKTDERNGVLIFIALQSRQFAIIGDSGINQSVPEGFWDAVKDEMTSCFVTGDMIGGITKGVLMAGEQLKRYFPRNSDDKNELSDTISYGK